MDIKNYVKKYNIPFEKVKSDYNLDFTTLFEEEKEWLSNLEDKIHLLKNAKNEAAFKDVIQKLKSNTAFTQIDTPNLSTFISRANTIIRIANRINNFKEGATLDKGKSLKLIDFFNSVSTTDSFNSFNFELNDNLKNFLPHIYSVIKHCQKPTEYPVYYKYWKNILREVLSKDDDYDSMCDFYRKFPIENRHLNFASYFGTIGVQIAKNITSSSLIITKDSKEYNYLTKDVINIERYNSILDNQIDINTSQEEITIQYWLYAPGENASKWNDFHDDGIMALGWDDIGDLAQYKNRNEIKEALVNAYGGEGSKKNDVSANDDFINKVNIGDIVIVKKGRRELLGYGIVTSDYYFDENRIEYKCCREIEWKLKGNWKVDFSLVLKTLTDITKYSSDHPKYDNYYERLMGIMEENNSNNHRENFIAWLNVKYVDKSGTTSSYIKAIDILSNTLSKEIFRTTDDQFLEELYEDLIKEQRNQGSKYFHKEAPSYGSNGFYSASIKSYREFLKSIKHPNVKINDQKMNFPLNTILYGPPGTGKTYNTILRAAQIIENREIDSYDEALSIFKANLHDRIEFITFHQNYSYEDFIQGLRPDTDNDKELTFERKDGVFKVIADRALENLNTSEKAPEEASKDALFDKALEVFIDKIQESDEDYPIHDSVAYITEIKNNAFRYKGVNWGNGQLMKFKDLKEFYRNNVKDRKDVKGLKTISGLANQHASYFLRVYNEIIKFIPKKVEIIEKPQKANYVIIIDEINRANISRVFGELITLIEPDKRSHGAIPLEVRLPSGDPFIVPSNLHIIGTMNTADKSIALLDIALRRRFEFESMYPRYEIKDQEIYDSDILKKINGQITKSKGHDFQIGHAFFMGDNKDLIERMNKKVIPLLLEYYMNDEKEVKGILNFAGLKIEDESWPLRIIGKND